MYEEDYWFLFTNSGNVFDYLAYKIEDRNKEEVSVTRVGVDADGAVSCCNRDNFICSTYR
ncbi:hypothetical protein [Konateibacter massiliensis]|uniref:hypothetical protein n=1 Tax=Konateibacter massiliensis TaxID=2002841 RepID=UPI00117BBDC6|nr:hypothetical protein [Konateibacter massiliensis]